MDQFCTGLIQGILETSILEWIAVLFSLLYVIFAAYEKQICWVFGLLSSFVLIFICFDANLFLESILQFIYVVLAVYGWYNWTIRKNAVQKNISISTWGWSRNVLFVLILACLGFVIGYLFDVFTKQSYPYVDAHVFVFSLFATYLVTLKKIENWIYWVIIDFVCIFLFYSRGLELISVQYLLFCFMATFAYFKWKKLWINESNEMSN
jgi:nicotinamide mononucleotide transporter